MRKIKYLKLDCSIDLYVIVNKEGRFFRAKGYHGYGKTWVEDISQARIYSKIGAARGVVTWFSNTYPEFGIPDIVEFSIINGKFLDETNRVNAAMLKKKKQKIEYAEQEVERARKNLISTNARVELDYQRKVDALQKIKNNEKD